MTETIIGAVAAYLLIGVLLVVFTVWLDGEMTVQQAPWALFFVLIWPIVVLIVGARLAGYWWDSVKGGVIWEKRK